MTTSALIALGLTILFGALVSGTPLLFSAVGEIIAERSGVMNLGLEGLMLVGAMGGFAAWFHTNNLILGLLAGTLFGGLLVGTKLIQPQGIASMLQGVILFVVVGTELLFRYRVRLEKVEPSVKAALEVSRDN